jgi:adenylate kinase
MGPPGSFRQDITTALCEEMGGYKPISPGELFKKEIAKKTETGKRIMACFKAYHYVDDEIVIELVKNAIKEAEADKRSWILQGFPRTKVQALSL